MTTFPENTLSQFTTLLPQQLNLSDFWEVALAEIAWTAAIQNITYGQFKYRVAAENSQNYDGGDSSENRKRKLSERPYGMVTMYQPPIRSVQETFVEKLQISNPVSILASLVESGCPIRSSESLLWRQQSRVYVFRNHIPRLTERFGHENTHWLLWKRQINKRRQQ